MRPEDDSCIVKVKEMYRRFKLYHVKVENKKKSPVHPTDRSSNLFLNAFINHHVHAEYYKKN